MAEALSHIQLEFDRLAKHYDEFYPQTPHRPMMKVLKNSNINLYADVLDVGCGTGRMTDLVAKSIGAKDVVGIDISRNMLSIAKRRNRSKSTNYEFALAEASALPFCDKSFDLILHNQTIQFYEDLELALNESLRILSKFGKIILILVSRNERAKKSPLSFISFAKKCLDEHMRENSSAGSTAKRRLKRLQLSEVAKNLGKNLRVKTHTIDYSETVTLEKIIKILKVRPFLLECLPDDVYEEICRKYVEHFGSMGLKMFRVKKRLTAICIEKEII